MLEIRAAFGRHGQPSGIFPGDGDKQLQHLVSADIISHDNYLPPRQTMYTQPEAELSFGFLLGDVFRLLRRDFELRVQQLGLTLTQWRAIAHLSRAEGMNQVALAELLEVTPITLTRLIDRMEEAGWVERRRDPCDRRAVCLHLTKAVQPLLEKMHAQAHATHRTALGGLKKKDETQMLRMLTHVKDNLIAAESSRKAASEGDS